MKKTGESVWEHSPEKTKKKISLSSTINTLSPNEFNEVAATEKRGSG